MRTLLCGALVLAAASAVQAADVAFGVRDVAVLEDGAGAARVLFHLNGVDELGDVAVAEAKLRFEARGESDSRVLRLRVHPVTTAWDANAVSWTTPWTRPGGDFEERLYSRVDLDLRGADGPIELDLTALVRESRMRGAASNGFLLTVHRADGVGLPVGDLPRFQELAGATVEIHYRRVPPARAERVETPR